MNETTNFQQFEKMHEEQLPVPKHKLHDWTHFAGLYAAEHVAATEFVIGATFVALGARTMPHTYLCCINVRLIVLLDFYNENNTL